MSSKTPKPRVQLTMAAAKRIERFLSKQHEYAIDAYGLTSKSALSFCQPVNEMRDAIRAAKGK